MSTDAVSPDEPLDRTDVELLDRLRGVVDRLDPVPPGLADRALFALTLDALHTELMEIQQLEEPAGALRTGADDVADVRTRTVTFASDAVTVMVTVAPTSGPAGTSLRLDGWCAPSARYDVALHRPRDVVRTQTDDDGAFVLADVAPGPASLVLRRADGVGPSVSTPVIEL